MARHLHEQSGGDPTDQGPVPELANEPRSPRSNEDFPDAPETEGRSGPGGDLTDEQLEDFADRLGLIEDDGTDRGRPGEDHADGDERDGARSARAGRAVRSLVGQARRPAARLLVMVGGATSTAGARLRSTGERLAGD